MLYFHPLFLVPIWPITTAFPTALDARDLSVTPAVIRTISPASSSCAGAPYPPECRTATQAAPAIEYSFKTYGITTAGEAAAVVSLMAFETADFKYQNNYYPGNPGQGTRNMQSAAFNLLYAKSIPSLAANVTAITEGAGAGALSSDQENSIRALLTGNDDLDFGSGAWFLTSQCSEQVRADLKEATLAGWQAYITACVGTTLTDDRQTYYTTALSAFSG